jgi:hypothetical protein
MPETIPSLRPAAGSARLLGLVMTTVVRERMKGQADLTSQSNRS